MASILFSRYAHGHQVTPNRNLYLDEPPYKRFAAEIRLSIFLTAGMCVGLPSVVWALRILVHHPTLMKRVSGFIIFLLLTDFIEMALSPFIMMKLFTEEKCYHASTQCRVLSSLRSGASSCGLLFHQFVALEGILSWTHTHFSARMFSLCSSIVFPTTICLIVLICECLAPAGTFLNVHVCFAPLGVLLAMYKLMIESSTFVELNDRKSRGQGVTVLAVATVTLLLYMPGLYFIYTNFYYWTLDAMVMVNCLMSLRVITDPLLCVLVCRENLREQKPQTHTELHTDLRSV